MKSEHCWILETNKGSLLISFSEISPPAISLITTSRPSWNSSVLFFVVNAITPVIFLQTFEKTKLFNSIYSDDKSQKIPFFVLQLTISNNKLAPLKVKTKEVIKYQIPIHNGVSPKSDDYYYSQINFLRTELWLIVLYVCNVKTMCVGRLWFNNLEKYYYNCIGLLIVLSM